MQSLPDRLPLALRVYRLASRAATPLVPRLLAKRLARGKEHPTRIGERRGEPSLRRPDGPLIWVHGASVGEMLAVVPLIERICARDFTVLVTSGTVTSAALAGQRLPDGAMHQFVPVDVPPFAARFLDHWRPDLALFVESDLWPNLILGCSARKIPMILVNGRISERSFRRWRIVSGASAALLGRFDLCLAQSAADAARYRSLGAPRIATTGNLKLDVPAPPADQAKLDRFCALTRGRPIIVAASTHPGEDEMLVAAHRSLVGHFPQLLTVIVPRHPDRGSSISGLITASGLKPALRSRDEPPSATTDIYVADTLGELGLFYRLSPIVFMGGSLIRHGGQNPIEAIKLGAAIVHGPNVFNFADVYAALDESGGARQADTQEALVKQLGLLLAEPTVRDKMHRAGAGVVEELGGALDRTMTALEPYLMQLRIEMGAANA